MEMRGIIDNRLPEDIVGSDDIEGTLISALDLLEYMQGHDGCFVYHDSDLYGQIACGDEFSNWLFNLKIDPELGSFKKELIHKIEKSASIEKDEYGEYLLKVEEEDCADGLTVSIHTGTASVLYVAELARLWAAKQWYLSKYVNRDSFPIEAQDCFPNLFFHEHVKVSMDTLNADFNCERPYIVEHLQALDHFVEEFSRLRAEGHSFPQMCRAFEDFYQHRIECSAQSSRDSARKLDYSFVDDQKNSISLRCEMHTKLKWPDMDKQHQDRIYFHPGKPEIELGKVLIVHIGTHQ